MVLQGEEQRDADEFFSPPPLKDGADSREHYYFYAGKRHL